MATLNGDWFHSRSSSNLSELLTVRKLVYESRKPEYIGMAWSAGRHDNERMYQFAEAVNIRPSTMQTKIRAMIRYGFIKEGSTCPLIWTNMGQVWDDLYSVGNRDAANAIYEITLSISLAIFSFNNSPQQFSINPASGEMPLKFLFNSLSPDNTISTRVLSALIDGNTNRIGSNYSYWITDLKNSGLFDVTNDMLVYTGKYQSLVEDIKEFVPSTTLSDDDWVNIKNNPLIEKSPFQQSIRNIFEYIASEYNIRDYIENGNYTAPLIEAIATQDDTTIPDIDILSTNLRFTRNTRRVRNATWSLRIKRKYAYNCSVPMCDVEGQLFVEAAHIKPDSAEEVSSIPHRAHILNGLCLCKHCHTAFDKGYFTLTDAHRVLTSKRFADIVDQNLKRVILASNDHKIKSRSDNRWPLPEFIRYHRDHKFLEG